MAAATFKNLILPAKAEHAARIAEIYNYYILNTVYTFEEQPVTAEQIILRMQDISSIKWLVLVLDNKVEGYAYAAKWKGRAAYKHSAEISVYLDHKSTGNGMGLHLYNTLLKELKTLNYRAIIAGIAVPNPVSVVFHEKFGFTKVAHFTEVGYKFNKWIDVAYWQLML